MKKYFVQTFGCAMNQADSEKINMIFLQSGFIKAKSINDADVVIFNTCSVRQKGEDRVFGMIEEIDKVRKSSPPTPLLKGEGSNRNIIIGVTGCMVRKTGISGKYLDNYKRDKNKAKKISFLDNKSSILNNDDKLFPRSDGKIDFVFRIEEVKYVPHILTNIIGENIGNDDKFDDYLKSKQLRESKSSANIIIQTGCDNYCSFCIVPFTRGAEISREKDEIVDEIKEAVQSGATEINLLGQNVNSYGKQFVDKKLWNKENAKWNSPPPSPLPDKEGGLNSKFKSPFRELLEEINDIKGVERIRFTSSNPHDMTRDILDSHFDLKNNCNYLHFALQSGSNKMLKRMNRKHTYEDFKKQVEYLRSRDPLFSISTDIIVGYSGETDEMFKETVKAFKECVFDFAFIARYSVRKGTLASKIYPDDISDEIKSQRWHILNDLLLENIKKRNKLMIGREEYVLVSKEKDGFFSGRTRNFKEVFLKGENVKIGDTVKVKIIDMDRYVLKGEIVKTPNPLSGAFKE